MLLPLQGASLRTTITQGEALGYVLIAPMGRIAHNNCGSYFCIYYKEYNKLVSSKKQPSMIKYLAAIY